MNNTQYDVASGHIGEYVDGLAELIEMKIAKGFEPYMISFMFKSKRISGKETNEIMENEIDRVFGRFLTEVVRNPWSKKNRHKRPILIACRDWPVKKSGKRAKQLLPWEGAHAGGILLIPPKYRLKTGVKDHFETVERATYVRPGDALSRIHITHIENDIARVTDYSFKQLKRRNVSFDDIIVHPQARVERPTTKLFDGEKNGAPGGAWDVWGRGSLRHLAVRP